MERVILSAAGAAGFAALYRMKWSQIGIAGIGGAIAWFCYELLSKWTDVDSTAMFTITAAVVFITGIASLKGKDMVRMIATPILIPFIPGAYLYAVMYDIVSHSSKVYADANILLKQSASMALGILFGRMLLILLRVIVTEQKKKMNSTS